MSNAKASYSGFLFLFTLVSVFVVACGQPGGPAPTVLSTLPVSGAMNATLNTSISATFSDPMAAASISTTTFTLTSGSPPVAVPGTVIYAQGKATFWPSARLAPGTRYNATISTGAMSADRTPLAVSHGWSFTTGDTLGAEQAVQLGTAGTFVILAKTGVSTVPPSVITGDVGVSPAAATFLTGFSLTADASNVFSTSPQVTGKIYAPDYTPPSPAKLTTAVLDMELAFTAAAGRAPSATELGAGNIGGMTLTSGVYKWSSGLLIPTNLTLTGSATDVWIFQVAQDLTLSNGIRVVLAGGALSKNIFWQVSGRVELGTTSHCEGVVMSQTSITMATGATINGRLLAQSAVNLDSSTVVQPAP